jgi:peptidoglycan/xylan/chitin deacetylase (PgdA/CDA1 family)
MPVLMYHRFGEHDHEKGVHGTWISLTRFEGPLKLLKRVGYQTLTFSDFAQRGLIDRLQPNQRYVMITVDDGYVDNLQRMLPLLQKYGFRAVVYVVTGEDHNRWDVEDAQQPEIRADLMNESELRDLCRSGHVELGGHTVSHQKLTEIDPERRWQEIVQNKDKLASISGAAVFSFAYPYGLLDEATKQSVREAGYRFAVATDSGPVRLHEDPLQIRRIAIFPSTGLWRFWRKIKGDYNYKKIARAQRATQKAMRQTQTTE